MPHRDDLLQKLKRYQPVDAADLAHAERLRAFVLANPRCFDRSLLSGHITGSAWIVDESGRRVLLTHHRKLGKWLQLGGHADGDSDVLGVALREAREESGLGNIRPLSDEIFDLDVHRIPARPGEPEHDHFDVRFAFVAGPGRFRVSGESIDLAWIEVDKMAALTGEASMLRMARKWLSRMEVQP